MIDAKYMANLKLALKHQNKVIKSIKFDKSALVEVNQAI